MKKILFSSQNKRSKEKRELEKRLKRYEVKELSVLSEEDNDFIKMNQHYLIPLIELLFEAGEEAKDKRELTKKEYSCLSFILLFFTEIRYKIDKNEPSAVDLSKNCQRMLAERAHLLSPPLLFELLQAFSYSMLPLSEELKNAFYNSNLQLCQEGAPLRSQEHQELDSQWKELIKAMMKGDPFEAYFNLQPFHSVMPANDLFSLLGSFLYQPEGKIRDVVPLFCLNDSGEIRKGVYKLLLQAPEMVTPEGLRRLITIRNWLPHEEEKFIDAVVDAVRLKGIECAPIKAGKIVELATSTFDGSGCQALTVLIEQSKSKILTNFLCKEATGIREPWHIFKAKKSDFTNSVNHFRKGCSMEVAPTKSSYLNKIVPHYLAIGRKFGKIPELEVLRLLEILGNNWVPREMDMAEELRLLVDVLPKEKWTPEKKWGYLEKIEKMHRQESMFDTWFTCNDRAQSAIMNWKGFNKPPSSITEREWAKLSNEMLEPERDLWLTKVFCSALRDFSLTRPKERWLSFAALAEKMLEGDELYIIPFFRSIMTVSLFVYARNTLLNFDITSS